MNRQGSRMDPRSPAAQLCSCPYWSCGGKRRGSLPAPAQGGGGLRAVPPRSFPGCSLVQRCGLPQAGCPPLAPLLPLPARHAHTQPGPARGRHAGRDWQLSCSHRSHYSPQSRRLLTLLLQPTGSCAAPAPTAINAGSRRATLWPRGGRRSWGSSIGVAGNSPAGSARSPFHHGHRGGGTGRCNAQSTGQLPVLPPAPLPTTPRGSGSAGVPQPCLRCQHSPLLLQAERDVLVVAEVVGAGVIEGAVGEPHGVAPNRVWGDVGRGQESARLRPTGSMALPDCHGWLPETPQQNPLAPTPLPPSRLPPGPSARPPPQACPPSLLGCVTRSRPRDW